MRMRVAIPVDNQVAESSPLTLATWRTGTSGGPVARLPRAWRIRSTVAVGLNNEWSLKKS